VESRCVSWEKLKDLKVSNPVKVAEYAVTNRFIEEPPLIGWVPHVLRRRNRISISRVKSRYDWKTTHKVWDLRRGIGNRQSHGQAMYPT
jgi:hypothetical protein